MSKQKIADRFLKIVMSGVFVQPPNKGAQKAMANAAITIVGNGREKTALAFPMHPAINRARLRGMWGNPCRSHLVASFRLKIRQTFRSARKHCEVRYQFRNFLWISTLQ